MKQNNISYRVLSSEHGSYFYASLKCESRIWAKSRILNDLNRTFSDSATDHIEEDLEGDEIKESNNPLYSSR